MGLWKHAQQKVAFKLNPVESSIEGLAEKLVPGLWNKTVLSFGLCALEWSHNGLEMDEVDADVAPAWYGYLKLWCSISNVSPVLVAAVAVYAREVAGVDKNYLVEQSGAPNNSLLLLVKWLMYVPTTTIGYFAIPLQKNNDKNNCKVMWSVPTASCVCFLNLFFFSFLTLSFPFPFMLFVFVMGLISFLQLNSVYYSGSKAPRIVPGPWWLMSEVPLLVATLALSWLCHHTPIVINHPCICKMQGTQCTATALVLTSFSRCPCITPSHVDVQHDVLLKSVFSSSLCRFSHKFAQSIKCFCIIAWIGAGSGPFRSH